LDDTELLTAVWTVVQNLSSYLEAFIQRRIEKQSQTCNHRNAAFKENIKNSLPLFTSFRESLTRYLILRWSGYAPIGSRGFRGNMLLMKQNLLIDGDTHLRLLIAQRRPCSQDLVALDFWRVEK
jgi:hypothetical protein